MAKIDQLPRLGFSFTKGFDRIVNKLKKNYCAI